MRGRESGREREGERGRGLHEVLVEVHPSPLCTCIEERDTEDTRVIGEEEREGERERGRERFTGGPSRSSPIPSPLCTCIQ